MVKWEFMAATVLAHGGVELHNGRLRRRGRNDGRYKGKSKNKKREIPRRAMPATPF
ncbi:MAG: hypothetical protein LBG16_01430 [Elusimicrobiota bacterium]|nr:hypothetical protein [Elusimicrobiota bacterium]